MQALLDFEQHIIDTVIDLWRDNLRLCIMVADTSKTCCEISYHLCGSSEHFFKLSVQFDAFNGYFVVNFQR